MQLPKVTRKFLPADAPLDQSHAVQAWYQNLAQQEISTPSDFSNWLAQWSELESAIRQEGALRYVKMTCNTSDKDHASAYTRFVEEIEPIASLWSDKLRRQLHACPHAHTNTNLTTWMRQVEVDLQLFREENVALETRIALEVQEYQKITGSMSVSWNGEEKPLAAMTPHLLAAERSEREKAWHLVAQRRLQDRLALDTAFAKLFDLRLQVSRNAGFSDYVSYIFKAKGRFDYSPADCREFHKSVAECVVPRARAQQNRRARRMGIAELRPWDLECDTQGRPPLRPFTGAEQMLQAVESLFMRLHPRMGTWFSAMRKQQLLDVETRRGKAPGGYQISLDENRVPFIFMNSSGTNGDLYTLLHESGHAFHQYAMADQPLIAYRDCPSEFAEVASMSMELIASDDLSDIYTPAQAARSRREELQDVLRLLPWVAQIDAFQHALYAEPEHSSERRTQIWLQLQDIYGPTLDWSGLEQCKAAYWQRQLHLFEVPFYYIEYGIAQLGALQIWANFRRNPQQALESLLSALALGSSRPLPDLFAAAGIPFGFGRDIIEPLMDLVENEILRLEQEEANSVGGT